MQVLACLPNVIVILSKILRKIFHVGIEHLKLIVTTKMLNTYTFRVEMTCRGCAGKLQRILNIQKDKGRVVSFDVDFAEKRVTVTTLLTVEEIHAELKQSGKPITLLSSSKQESFGIIEAQLQKN